jgi:hypothetical protein
MGDVLILFGLLIAGIGALAYWFLEPYLRNVRYPSSSEQIELAKIRGRVDEGVDEPSSPGQAQPAAPAPARPTAKPASAQGKAAAVPAAKIQLKPLGQQQEPPAKR